MSSGVGEGFQKPGSGTFGFSRSNYDVSFGAHSCLSEPFLLGGALGYENDSIDSTLTGKAHLKTGQAAIYSAYQSSRVYLLTEIMAARTWSDYSRPIHFGTLYRSAKSKPRLNHGKVGLELGFNAGGCHFLTQPFISGAAQMVQQSRVRETGAESLNLALEASNKWIANSMVGCHFNFNYSALKIALDLMWQHDYGNLHTKERVHFSQFGSTFPIIGPHRGHDGAIGVLFVTGPLGKSWDIYVESLGELWSNWHAFAFNAGVSYRW